MHINEVIVVVIVLAALIMYKMSMDTSNKIAEYLRVIDEEKEKVDYLEFFAVFGFKVDEYDSSKNVIMLDKMQQLTREKLILLDRTFVKAVGKHLSDIRVAHKDVNSPDI